MYFFLKMRLKICLFLFSFFCTNRPSQMILCPSVSKSVQFVSLLKAFRTSEHLFIVIDWWRSVEKCRKNRFLDILQQTIIPHHCIILPTPPTYLSLFNKECCGRGVEQWTAPSQTIWFDPTRVSFPSTRHRKAADVMEFFFGGEGGEKYTLLYVSLSLMCLILFEKEAHRLSFVKNKRKKLVVKDSPFFSGGGGRFKGEKHMFHSNKIQKFHATNLNQEFIRLVNSLPKYSMLVNTNTMT